MNLPNGHTLQNGKYRITSVIGQGGFGITYKGVWLTEVKGPLGTIKTEVPVCIKEYFFKDYCYREPDSFQVKVHSDMGKALFERFKEKQIKESKILSEVQHPYIVNVLEAFEENNTAYIAMEYISGYSLKYYMDREGTLPEGHVLHYIRQVGEALQFIHGKSILHLDIKPNNILIDVEGNARLIDFGVSKRYDIEERETSTTTLTLSKGFAAIEQYDSEGIQNFTPCPDVYSLGATMYNLLTGVLPGESILRVTHPLRKPTELNPSISSTTEKVILKAMEVVPEDRYQSIREMMESLDFSKEDKSPVLKSEDDMTGEEVPVNEDSTIIDDGDEETIVEKSDAEAVEEVKHQHQQHLQKKNRKMAVFFMSLLLIVFVGGWAGTRWIRNGKKITTSPLVQQGKQNNKNDSNKIAQVQTTPSVKKKEVVPVKEDSLGEVYKKKEKKTSVTKVENTKPESNAKPIKEQETTQKVAADKKTEKESAKKSTTDIDNKYNNLYQSGIKKMNAGDYVGAKTDFEQAKEVKLTEEVVRQQIECDSKLAEEQVKTREALYEIKRSFGQLTIVRKKASGRYGAINDKAIEIIPCKYLNVGITDEGRAFEREDGLFDIYNITGKKVKDGSTYY